MLQLFSGAENSGPENFGNPSSIHWAGRRAKVAMDEAREQIALSLGIKSEEELVFTGSGSEATNAALKGAFFYATQAGKKFHLITTLVEHEATLETANFIGAMGGIVDRLSVDSDGQIKVFELEARLQESAALKNTSVVVSVMAANNETGALFPLRIIAELCQRYGAILHVDAVQALGKCPEPFLVSALPAQMISFSAHKIGGPKGVGALYLSRGLKLASLIHGGAQERKRRAGTYNLSGIVGFGIAAQELATVDSKRLAELRDLIETGVRARIPDVRVMAQNSPRVVNTTNLLFPGVRGDSLLMSLDLEGIAVSTGSACASGTVNPSHVLLAMGLNKQEAASAIRVSLGPENTLAEAEHFLDLIPKIVERIRSK